MISLNNKGFTLIEALISLVIILLLFRAISFIVASTKYGSELENYKIMALERNIAVVEKLKSQYYSTGDYTVLYKAIQENLQQSSNYSYTTTVEVTPIHIGDNINPVLTDNKDLIYRNGSKSALYKVKVSTKIYHRVVPGTDIIVYLSNLN